MNRKMEELKEYMMQHKEFAENISTLSPEEVEKALKEAGFDLREGLEGQDFHELSEAELSEITGGRASLWEIIKDINGSALEGLEIRSGGGGKPKTTEYA